MFYRNSLDPALVCCGVDAGQVCGVWPGQTLLKWAVIIIHSRETGHMVTLNLYTILTFVLPPEVAPRTSTSQYQTISISRL